MKKFWKTVKDNLVTLASFIIVFPIVFLFVLILTSDAKFSDFFTMERVSYLKNRDPRITRDIVVDTTQICNEGGIKTLAENLIEKIAAKRPKWRFIVLIPKDALHGGFPRLAPYDNVKFLNVQLENNKIFLFMRNISNFLTFGLFRDKITQLWFYNNIYIDDKCDLFFDPYAEMNINDFSIPKISLIHDLAYIDLPMTKTIDGYKWIKANSKAILEYSQKIITVSNFSKKRIMEEYKVDDNFVRSIPIRLADRITAESKNFSSAISKKYDLTKGAYLIFHSTFWPNKNHIRLLKAFSKFLSLSKSNIKLAVVGKFQKMRNSISEILSKYNLRGKVVFTNFIPDDELNVLLSNALAFVHPSLYEGFGMPVIEAMTAGVPVICSNAGSLPEVAGDAALFFDPYNVDEIAAAMKRIVEDEGLRRELIQKGYKQAAKFADADKMVDEYIEVFEEVMAQNEKNYKK